MTSRPPLLRRVVAALVSGLIAGLVAETATALAFYLPTVASGSGTNALGQLLRYFLISSLIYFVLIAVGAITGAISRWYTALIVGLVSSVVGAVVGTTLSAVTAGNPISGPLLNSVFESLLTTNLAFIVFGIILAIVVAPRAFGWMLRLLSTDASVHRVALVRPPAATLARGQVTHIERSAVSVDLANSQWDAYVAALDAAGFTTVEVDASDAHPDSVFVEDAVVILGQTAVIASPGAETRRGEQEAVEAAVRELGLRVRRIELPGTLDGGDVLKIGRTVYVGRSGRTNSEGIRQLRSLGSSQGFTVVAVPVSKVLHLKTAVTALPDGTVIGYPPLVENPELFPRFLAVPEPEGSAVVVLSNDAVLLSSAAPGTAALLIDLGYRVVTVDISEFEKLEGCVTCLSVRIR